MEKKIGLSINLPEGKLPGFYAQIVKGLANRVTLFDRDKEMLVLDTAEDRDAVRQLLGKYSVEAEEMVLILLPAHALLYDGFTDYGFTGRLGNRFLYGSLAAVFRFAGDTAEKEPMLRQMEEHLLARYTESGEERFAVDSQHDELIAGIARAYGCTVCFD